MSNINNFEWGDILQFEFNGEIYITMLEESGKLYARNLPEDLEDITFSYATPIQVREFMRWLTEAGRLFKPGYDAVDKPGYYTSGENSIECIDAMVAAKGIEKVKNFCECNAFKYIWRCSGKNGTQDIKKAIWYENKFIELDTLQKKIMFEQDDGSKKMLQ